MEEGRIKLITDMFNSTSFKGSPIHVKLIVNYTDETNFTAEQFELFRDRVQTINVLSHSSSFDSYLHSRSDVDRIPSSITASEFHHYSIPRSGINLRYVLSRIMASHGYEHNYFELREVRDERTIFQLLFGGGKKVEPRYPRMDHYPVLIISLCSEEDSADYEFNIRTITAASNYNIFFKFISVGKHLLDFPFHNDTRFTKDMKVNNTSHTHMSSLSEYKDDEAFYKMLLEDFIKWYPHSNQTDYPDR